MPQVWVRTPMVSVEQEGRTFRRPLVAGIDDPGQPPGAEKADDGSVMRSRPRNVRCAMARDEGEAAICRVSGEDLSRVLADRRIEVSLGAPRERRIARIGEALRRG